MTIVKQMNGASTWLLVSSMASIALTGGCTKNPGEGFYGQGKRPQLPVPATDVRPTTVPPAPEAKPPVNANSGNQAGASTAAPTQISTPAPVFVPVMVPVQPQIIMPQVMPPPPSSPPPPVQPAIPQSAAEDTMLYIPVTPIENMENGSHIISDGYYATLKDSGGKIIASGPMTMESVILGHEIESDDAYPAMMLAVRLDYMGGESGPTVRAGEAQSGKGTLSICAAESGERVEGRACVPFKSDMGLSDSSRASELINEPVGYAPADKGVQITEFLRPHGDTWTSRKAGVSLYHASRAALNPDKGVHTDRKSPLVLDLVGDGKLDLLAVWNKKAVKFDVGATGQVVRTGWVGPKSGLLVLDSNKNGKVDDGGELFGEYSAKSVDDLAKKPVGDEKSSSKSFENGFLALAQYDDNHDHQIDGKDKVFSKLMVWVDKNSDATAQKGELQSLNSFHIVAIDLRYEKVEEAGKSVFAMGNEVKFKAAYRLKNGTKRDVFDVWFGQGLQSHFVAK